MLITAPDSYLNFLPFLNSHHLELEAQAAWRSAVRTLAGSTSVATSAPGGREGPSLVPPNGRRMRAGVILPVTLRGHKRVNMKGSGEEPSAPDSKQETADAWDGRGAWIP